MSLILEAVSNSQPRDEIFNGKKKMHSSFSVYIDAIDAAQRKSHHYRSKMKHLFINWAPPLNQTEPDPTHWTPDTDYNVVLVRTAGPSHTLLGVLLTTPFLQPYRLELSHTQDKNWTEY